MRIVGNRASVSAIVIAGVLLVLGLCHPLAVASAEEGGSVYTVSGNVYDASGELIRGPFAGGPPTRVAIDSLGLVSTVSSEGTYSLTNVPVGDYVIRVFYGSIDQTYTYRWVNVSADTIIDWHYGKAWVQGVVVDGDGRPMATVPGTTPVRVTIVETGQLDDTDVNGYFEIADVDIGEYYTIKALFGTADRSTSFTVREIVGSAPNHVEFMLGRNGVFGFVEDEAGNPLAADVSISPDGRSTTTNTDGFYLFENVTVGFEQTIQATLTSQGGQALTAVKNVVKSVMLWTNFTTAESLSAPEFLTESGTVASGAYSIEWGAVEGAESYILYEGGASIYEGASTSFDVTGRAPGAYTYAVRAMGNGVQSELSNPVTLDVIGGGGDTGTWSPGMSWTFQFRSDAKGVVTNDQVIMTVISVETILNRTGAAESAYKIREVHESEPDVVYYSWYNVDTLDLVARFSDTGAYTSTSNCTWVYDGEPFPYEVGSAIPVYYSLKTVVSIAGHPVIAPTYLNNTFEVVGMEMVTVPAGTFLCYNITVTNDDDGRVLWNYYYNDTVRHWVKMIDRLPTTRADLVTYELISYDVPQGPVFVTEGGERSVKSFDVQWAAYDGAVEYVLYENGEEVYRGAATSYEATSREDGSYEYVVEAVLSNGQTVPGRTLTIVVDYVVPAPSFTTEAGTVDGGEIIISWTAVDGADRYVLFENDVEVYNGTETSFTVTDRSDGAYRYRVQAVDGNKVSELSPSLFITFEDKGKEDTGGGDLILIAAAVGIVALAGAALLLMKSRK